MASPKQIAANQANSKKSTGPRTPKGKSIARFNAVRHALTGQLTLVTAEEHEAYLAFEHRLTASLAPAGEQELHVAARIVRDTWRLHRAAANEENIYALGLIDLGKGDLGKPTNVSLVLTADPASPEAVAISNAETFLNRSRDFNLASLYEQRLNRSLHKDYALFRELQKERKQQEKQDILEKDMASARTSPRPQPAPPKWLRFFAPAARPVRLPRGRQNRPPNREPWHSTSHQTGGPHPSNGPLNPPAALAAHE